MKKTSISMLLAAVLATALAVSGCHKKTDDVAAPTPPAAASDAASASTGTVASAAASGSAAAPAAAASGSAASNLPPECDNYLKKLEACVNKLAASHPDGVDQARQKIEAARQQFSAFTDKATLGQVCKQMSDAILPQLAKEGCN